MLLQMIFLWCFLCAAASTPYRSLNSQVLPFLKVNQTVALQNWFSITLLKKSISFSKSSSLGLNETGALLMKTVGKKCCWCQGVKEAFGICWHVGVCIRDSWCVQWNRHHLHFLKPVILELGDTGRISPWPILNQQCIYIEFFLCSS